MHIARFRYAWEPNVYYQADSGAPAGGGADPPAAGQQGGEGKDDGKPGAGEGGEGQGGGEPARFSQADVDRIVAQRLEDEKRRAKTREDKARAEAAEEAARKNGEWEKVAESRQSRIAELEGEVERLKGEIESSRLETIRERVAAKHKLPAPLAARLRGTDEASLEADARELAKLVAAPKAPETEAGRGNGQGGRPTVQETAEALRKTGRYASVG